MVKEIFTILRSKIVLISKAMIHVLHNLIFLVLIDHVFLLSKKLLCHFFHLLGKKGLII